MLLVLGRAATPDIAGMTHHQYAISSGQYPRQMVNFLLMVGPKSVVRNPDLGPIVAGAR
jgi:hypothetical protein